MRSLLHNMHGDSTLDLDLGGPSSAPNFTIPIDMSDTDSSSDDDDDDEDDEFSDMTLKPREGETEVEMRRRLLADMVRLRRKIFAAFVPGGRSDNSIDPDLPMAALSLSSSPPDLVPSTANAREDEQDSCLRRRKTSDGHSPSPSPKNEDPLPVAATTPLPPRNRTPAAAATLGGIVPAALISATESAVEVEASNEGEP